MFLNNCSRLIYFSFFWIFVTAISANNSYGYSCNNGKSVNYRADFHIQDENGKDLRRGFVYFYPQTQMRNSGKSFGRGNDKGVATALVQVCVPRGKKAPTYINATCLIKDPWEGEYYKVEKIKVKMYPDAGWDTITHPIILLKK